MDYVSILADILDDLHNAGHEILSLDYQIQSKREYSREPHAEEGDYARAFSADDPLDDCYSQSWPVIIRLSQAPLSQWWTLRNFFHRTIGLAASAIDGKDESPSQRPSVKIIRLVDSMADDIEQTAPRDGVPVSMGSTRLWHPIGGEWQEKLNALGEFCRDVRAIAQASSQPNLSAPPVEDDSKSEGQQKRPTTYMLMAEEHQKNPEAAGWTAEQWGLKIGRSASTIVECKYWKSLNVVKAGAKIDKLGGSGARKGRVNMKKKKPNENG